MARFLKNVPALGINTDTAWVRVSCLGQCASANKWEAGTFIPMSLLGWCALTSRYESQPVRSYVAMISSRCPTTRGTSRGTNVPGFVPPKSDGHLWSCYSQNARCRSMRLILATPYSEPYTKTSPVVIRTPLDGKECNVYLYDKWKPTALPLEQISSERMHKN